MSQKRPIIGITLDLVEGIHNKYAYSTFPWYALRKNYADAIEQAGGIPIFLGYNKSCVNDVISFIDGLLIPGGDCDIDPSLYNQKIESDKVSVNINRCYFEYELLKHALKVNMPFLGICNGMQLLNVVLGGSLYQHLPDHIIPNPRLNQTNGFESEGAGAYMKYVRKAESRKIRLDHLKMGLGINHGIVHEQPHPKHVPSHQVIVQKRTKLSLLSENDTFDVNSSHHQAINQLGKGLITSAIAPDGVIEAIELPNAYFTMGIEWHPEYLQSKVDMAIFKAFVQAASI